MDFLVSYYVCACVDFEYHNTIGQKKKNLDSGLDTMFSVFNQVKSERLVNDLGFKTRVTLGDILDILKAWRKSSKTSFKARCANSSAFSSKQNDFGCLSNYAFNLRSPQ